MHKHSDSFQDSPVARRKCENGWGLRYGFNGRNSDALPWMFGYGTRQLPRIWSLPRERHLLELTETEMSSIPEATQNNQKRNEQND